MNAHRTGTPMLASSGYCCRVQEGWCIGCGVCADRCDHGAISLERDNSLPVPLELEELIGKR